MTPTASTSTTFSLAGQNYQLRRALPSDLDAVVGLLADDPVRRADNPAEAGRSPAYGAAFEAIDSDPAQLLAVVADEAGNVVATMQLTVIPGLARLGATRLLVEAVRVDGRLRGKGLGSAMMGWAVAEGRRRGASLIQLTSDKSRVEAHRFYEQLGFTPSHIGFKLFI